MHLIQKKMIGSVLLIFLIFNLPYAVILKKKKKKLYFYALLRY